MPDGVAFFRIGGGGVGSGSSDSLVGAAAGVTPVASAASLEEEETALAAVLSALCVVADGHGAGAGAGASSSGLTPPPLSLLMPGLLPPRLVSASSTGSGSNLPTTPSASFGGGKTSLVDAQEEVLRRLAAAAHLDALVVLDDVPSALASSRRFAELVSSALRAAPHLRLLCTSSKPVPDLARFPCRAANVPLMPLSAEEAATLVSRLCRARLVVPYVPAPSAATTDAAFSASVMGLFAGADGASVSADADEERRLASSNFVKQLGGNPERVRWVAARVNAAFPEEGRVVDLTDDVVRALLMR